MTTLEELRRRKRDKKLRTAPMQANGKPVYGSQAYDDKMRDVAAKARAVVEANRLKAQLAEFEAATQKCFLCSDYILDDDIAVPTGLGPIHRQCQQEYAE